MLSGSGGALYSAEVRKVFKILKIIKMIIMKYNNLGGALHSAKVREVVKKYSIRLKQITFL